MSRSVLLLALWLTACSAQGGETSRPDPPAAPTSDGGPTASPPRGDGAATSPADPDTFERDAGAAEPTACATDLDCSEDERCLPTSCAASEGICAKPPDTCAAACDVVCGCDGLSYTSECEAARAGTTVSRGGTCATCGAFDAFGEGSCPVPWGFKWNGSDCVEVRGCSCVGSECDELFNYQGCELHRRACACD